MQMSVLVQNVSLITVIYSMLWLLLIIAVILRPTHLSTAHSSVSVPSSRLRKTRAPRGRAQLYALSYSVKQSHRDGLSLSFFFSFKSCRTGPSGCRWSKRNLSSALVCDPFSFAFFLSTTAYISVISVNNLHCVLLWGKSRNWKGDIINLFLLFYFCMNLLEYA